MKMVKQILLTVLCLSLKIPGGQALVIVVSDIDDTIKVSQVRNSTQMVLGHLGGTPPSFPYLIRVYQDIKRHYEGQKEEVLFYYLSSSPNFINVHQWLQDHLAPEGIIRQRNLWELMVENSYQYKVKNLKQFLLEHQKAAAQSGDELKLLFFGDNGEKDPLVYQSIFEDQDLKHERISIFIRRVYEGTEIRGIKYFTSEKDLLDDPLLSVILSPTFKVELQSIDYQELIPEFIQKELRLSEKSQEREELTNRPQ